MPNWVKVEIAWFSPVQKDHAPALGRQVADFLGVEFHQEKHLEVSRIENPLSVWDLLKARQRERYLPSEDKVSPGKGIQ